MHYIHAQLLRKNVSLYRIALSREVMGSRRLVTEKHLPSSSIVGSPIFSK